MLISTCASLSGYRYVLLHNCLFVVIALNETDTSWLPLADQYVCQSLRIYVLLHNCLFVVTALTESETDISCLPLATSKVEKHTHTKEILRKS